MVGVGQPYMAYDEAEDTHKEAVACQSSGCLLRFVTNHKQSKPQKLGDSKEYLLTYILRMDYQ